MSGRRAMPWWPGIVAVLAASVCALAGCASAPVKWDKPPAEVAAAPGTDSAFTVIEEQIAAQHGPRVSGFRLLDSNADGLKWRLKLVEAARHSIDLQYYVWFGDSAGQLLLARVIAAADRGVEVRILFDDLNTMLIRMTSPELRDAMMARVDEHPNIQVRVFNAWQRRDWLGRAAEGAAEFERVNRRMHNKQMIVDNRAAIIDGRNIGDEYFGLNSSFNFHDLDVLGIGPVARQASQVFDRYWNSDWVRSIPRPNGADTSLLTSQMIEMPPDAAAQPAIARLASIARQWREELQAAAAVLHPGTSEVHTDAPSRAAGARNHMPEAFRALLRSARSEVLISNAYIIPDQGFIDDLNRLSARGVQVRILTNSLASQDVPAVNAHYEGWRRAILAAGATLHEFRADAAIRAELVDTAPVESEFSGLHAKAMVVDREKSFIGSMNLDPRSAIFNAEMGVIVASAPLSQTLARRIERDMNSANSWQVTVNGEGALRWTSDMGQRDTQPARSLWQRIENLLFKLAPASYY